MGPGVTQSKCVTIGVTKAVSDVRMILLGMSQMNAKWTI